MTHLHNLRHPIKASDDSKAKTPRGQALARMLAEFDPAVHGGEFMPDAPVGKEVLIEKHTVPKRSGRRQDL